MRNLSGESSELDWVNVQKEYKRKGPNGRIIFSSEAKQEIVRRYRKGESTTRIGSDMGVSAVIILDALKERRVKLGWRRFRG
jgi:transposase-like protein